MPSGSGFNRDGYADNGHRNHSDEWVALKREGFDENESIAAFKAFRVQPAEFGWVVGSERQARAVQRIADALRSAFEAEIPGPWQQQQQQQTADNLRQLMDPVPALTMPDIMFEALLCECSSALRLRQLCSHQSGAHLFSNPDPAVRLRVFQLYKEEVYKRSDVVSGMAHLAAAAIDHVGSMMDRIRNKELEIVVEPVQEIDVDL